MDERIAAAFASGTLVRPSSDEPDLIHLTRALALHSGVERFGLPSASEQQLLELISPLKQIVFVLLDGLGMNLLRRLPAGSFMKHHLKRQIHATSPSTTACALTSIATGQWPSEHGVTGWYTHVPEYGLTMTTLPMVERYSGRPLAERGLGVEHLLPLRAYHAEMKCRVLTLLPTHILNTVYARYSRADTPARGYSSLADAVDKVVEHVRAGTDASHTHVYVPDIDTACHHHGVASDDALHLAQKADRELARLAAALEDRARLVISADHGLIDIPAAHHLALLPGEPILDLLQCPPSGDARLPIFHVRSGRAGEFAEAFRAKYGSALSLLGTADADELRLFGPGPMSAVARSRFGDFVGIAISPHSFHYVTAPAPVSPTHRIYVAQHAGFSPEEMNIPLIVA